MTGPIPDDVSAKTAQKETRLGEIVISVDAMGGDKGPAAVVAGLERFLAEEPMARVLLSGPVTDLAPQLARRNLSDRVTVIDAPDTVLMTDRPSQVMRHGKDTSMWAAIDQVRSGAAQACVSCGNTGALMAVAMLRLRKPSLVPSATRTSHGAPHFLTRPITIARVATISPSP